MERKMQVVVVDDEQMITDLIRTFIQYSSPNVDVHTFNDSVEARDFVRDNPVDVVISDYKMPQVNGLEVLESAGDVPRKVLISGFLTEVTEEKLERLNVTYFQKPVPMKALGRIIHEQAALPR